MNSAVERLNCCKRPLNRLWVFRFNRQNLKLRIWSTSFQHDRFTSRPASVPKIDAENPGYTTNEVSCYYGKCVITVLCHFVSTRHFQGVTPKITWQLFSRTQIAERTLEAPVHHAFRTQPAITSAAFSTANRSSISPSTQAATVSILKVWGWLWRLGKGLGHLL